MPVKNLFDYLEGSSTLEDFLEDFPSISRTTADHRVEVIEEGLHKGARGDSLSIYVKDPSGNTIDRRPMLGAHAAGLRRSIPVSLTRWRS